MQDNTSSGGDQKSTRDGQADQARKIDIASYYTHGDAENANKMVAGTYKDLYIIKGKFASSSVYGAFMIFFNHIYLQCVNFYGIVSHSFNVNDIDISQDWRKFEGEIEKNFSMGDHDDVLCNHMRESITTGMTMPFCTNLKKQFDQNDQIGISHVFQKFIQDRLGFQNLKVNMEYIQCTSLDMEMYSTSSRKMSEKSAKDDASLEKKDSLDDIQSLDDANDPLSGKEVKLVLNGSLLLAPIKGKDISSLAPGDRVKVKIIDKNPKGISVARAFKAYEDGKMLPITGRIVSMKSQASGGYKIFLVVAKGIFIKVDEEEDGIKIMMDDLGTAGGNNAETKAELNIPMIILLVVVFFILIGVIVFFVK